MKNRTFGIKKEGEKANIFLRKGLKFVNFYGTICAICADAS